MSKHIEIANDSSALVKGFESFFMLGTLSLVIYAFITSCKPLPNNLPSSVTYWIIVVTLFCLWIRVLAYLGNARRLEVKPGVFRKVDSKFRVFKTETLYTFREIETVEIRTGVGVFTAATFDVLLRIKSGKMIRVKTFSSEKEAGEFCNQVLNLLQEPFFDER